MKLLIAFALFAVALADEVQVVPLPRAPASFDAQPDIRQLIIPQHIIDAIKMGGMPVMRDADVADDLRVRVVEAPLDAPVETDFQDVPEAVEDLRIRFFNGPLDAPVEAVVAQEDDEGLEVHFVDAPLDVAEEIAAPSEAMMYAGAAEVAEAPEAVKIAEPYLPAVEAVAPEMSAPEPVRFVDAPMDVAVPVAEEIPAPEPVRIAEAPLPAFETAEAAAPELSVEPVKIAVPRFPGKQYADPRLR